MQQYTTLTTRKPKFTNANPRKFFTNYYQIDLNSKNSIIYQYAFSTKPKIALDSTRKLGSIVGKAWAQLTTKIGIIAVRGQNLYGKIGTNFTLNVSSKIIEKGQEVIYQIIIKKTKQISLKQMITSADYDENRFALQVINIDTKNRLLRAGMQELDRGKYFKKEQHYKKSLVENASNGFFVSRGFNFSSNLLRIGLCLHVDIFSRVIRQRSVLQQMQALSSKDQIVSLLNNAIVITRYGTFKAYKVTQVSFDLSPLSTFTPENTDTPVSFEQYYLKHYNVQIAIKNQPLLEVVLRTQRKMQKGGKKLKLQFKGHLIPELVSLVGMGPEHFSNRMLMKQMVSRIQLTVDQRISETEDVIKLINEKQNGLYAIGNAKVVEGYQLSQPLIQMKREFPAINGQIKIQKQFIKEPGQFKNWYFIAHQNHIDEAKELEKALRIASLTYGITIEESTFYQMKQTKPEFWSKDIVQQFEYLKEKKYAIPQIVMVLVGGPLKDNIYNQIKNLCTNKLKVCSQFATALKVVSLNKRNQLLSYATNLIFQMNSKIGKSVWEVPMKNPNLNKKVVATVAIAISKKNGQYTLGFVGTINLKLSKVYNQSKTRKKRQDFTSTQIRNIFVNWLRVFFQSNNRKLLPDVIALYREGLSESQAYKNVQIQLQGLQQALVQARIKTKQPNYNPQIVYMSLNKHSNRRFYEPLRSGAQQKFAPSYINPLSGSIIVDEFRHAVQKSGYSKSSKSLQTENIKPPLAPALTIRKCNMIITKNEPTITSCPTELTFHYHNPRRTPAQAFIQLTYEQCFNYYNWKGAVKVPACLQNADKLAKQACSCYKEDLSADNQLSKGFHFL